MTDVMMALGQYKFSVSTAAYQSLQRTTSYQWAEQDQIGKLQALQYLGEHTDTITLDGSVYPQWRGGAGQLDAMRASAGQGQPMTLVDGQGNVHGRWVIARVDELQDIHLAGGVPRRQQFTLQLKKYDDGP